MLELVLVFDEDAESSSNRQNGSHGKNDNRQTIFGLGGGRHLLTVNIGNRRAAYRSPALSDPHSTASSLSCGNGLKHTIPSPEQKAYEC